MSYALLETETRRLQAYRISMDSRATARDMVTAADIARLGKAMAQAGRACLQRHEHLFSQIAIAARCQAQLGDGVMAQRRERATYSTLPRFKRAKHAKVAIEVKSQRLIRMVTVDRSVAVDTAPVRDALQMQVDVLPCGPGSPPTAECGAELSVERCARWSGWHRQERARQSLQRFTGSILTPAVRGFGYTTLEQARSALDSFIVARREGEQIALETFMSLASGRNSLRYEGKPNCPVLPASGDDGESDAYAINENDATEVGHAILWCASAPGYLLDRKSHERLYATEFHAIAYESTKGLVAVVIRAETFVNGVARVKVVNPSQVWPAALDTLIERLIAECQINIAKVVFWIDTSCACKGHVPVVQWQGKAFAIGIKTVANLSLDTQVLKPARIAWARDAMDADGVQLDVFADCDSLGFAEQSEECDDLPIKELEIDAKTDLGLEFSSLGSSSASIALLD